LVYFLSSSAGRRANCQLDWHFLDLEKLNLQVRNYWFFIGVIGNRTDFLFIKQKICVNGSSRLGFQWHESGFDPGQAGNPVYLK